MKNLHKINAPVTHLDDLVKLNDNRLLTAMWEDIKDSCNGDAAVMRLNAESILKRLEE